MSGIINDANSGMYAKETAKPELSFNTYYNKYYKTI